jgi:hypothetical protein
MEWRKKGEWKCRGDIGETDPNRSSERAPIFFRRGIGSGRLPFRLKRSAGSSLPIYGNTVFAGSFLPRISVRVKAFFIAFPKIHVPCFGKKGCPLLFRCFSVCRGGKSREHVPRLYCEGARAISGRFFAFRRGTVGRDGCKERKRARIGWREHRAAFVKKGAVFPERPGSSL